MRTAGIIAEYNPFHNGHQYHIEKTRELTGADYCIVVMSGDYVQRGTPAIYNKYMRARTALLSGADLVLEMPVYGSAASAADFSACGVSMLEKTGVVDFLSFGSECGNMEALKEQAALYENENEEISLLIKEGLKSGLSWPAAREQAFRTFYSKKGEPIPAMSAAPNDILGCEYLKALKAVGSKIMPVTVPRTDPGYHSEERAGSFASATAARKAIVDGDFDFLSAVLPEAFFSCLENDPCPPVAFDDFSLLLCEKLLTMGLEEISAIAGMPSDLAAKLYKNRRNFSHASELVAASKDRQYTYARVSRCLLNLVLGVTKDEEAWFKSYGSAPWLRILGFRRDAAPLLSAMKKAAQAPVLTKVAGAQARLSEPAGALFQKHLQTAELYRMVCQLKSGRTMKNEFTRGILLV